MTAGATGVRGVLLLLALAGALGCSSSAEEPAVGGPASPVGALEPAMPSGATDDSSVASEAPSAESDSLDTPADPSTFSTVEDGYDEHPEIADEAEDAGLDESIVPEAEVALRANSRVFTCADRTPSVCAYAFEGASGGAKYFFPPGVAIRNLKDIGFNDKMTRLAVFPGCTFKVWDESEFRGTPIENGIDKSTHVTAFSMGSAWNDRVSSLSCTCQKNAYANVAAYLNTDHNLGGSCVALSRNAKFKLDDFAFDNQASSLWLMPGQSISIQSDVLGGTTQTYTTALKAGGSVFQLESNDSASVAKTADAGCKPRGFCFKAKSCSGTFMPGPTNRGSCYRGKGGASYCADDGVCHNK